MTIIMVHSLAIAVQSIKSIDDSTEAGSDEPYVLVTAANLVGLVPQVEVTLYGPFDDVDKGETHATIVAPAILPKPIADVINASPLGRRPFWALDNKTPAPIASPNDVVFIVSVMENDDGKPNTLRTLVKLAAVGSLAASTGMARATRVQKLIADIGGALGTPTGAPNFDDVVGTHELVLTAADLVPPPSKKRVKTVDFNGDNEGTFRVAVEMDFVS
jgi:hypothetical protein